MNVRDQRLSEFHQANHEVCQASLLTVEGIESDRAKNVKHNLNLA